MEQEKREEDQKAQEVELNNLESLIYKFKRDNAVKQCQPLLKKLTSLLEWVEGDGQSAGLNETKSKVEEINTNVSSLKLRHYSLRHLEKSARQLRLHQPHFIVVNFCAHKNNLSRRKISVK